MTGNRARRTTTKSAFAALFGVCALGMAASLYDAESQPATTSDTVTTTLDETSPNRALNDTRRPPAPETEPPLLKPAPATDFLTGYCWQSDHDLYNQDLTPEDLSAGVILPANCYPQALLFKRPNAVTSIEKGFKLYNIPEAQRQAVINQALLYIAGVSSEISQLNLALSHGADISAKDEEGRDIGTIIIQDSKPYTLLGDLEAIFYLHETHQYNLERLPDLTPYLWNYFSGSSWLDEEKAVLILEKMKKIPAFDPLKLEDPATGKNLLHIAAQHSAEKLLRFISDQNLGFSVRDKAGKHFLDYAEQDYFRQKLKDKYQLSENQTRFSLPGEAAVKFMSDYCKVPLWDIDLSSEDLAQNLILPVDCYNHAIYLNRSHAIASIEKGFEIHRIRPEIIQKIKNEALLYAAGGYADINRIRTAIAHGADITVRDADGKTLAELIMSGNRQAHRKLDIVATLYEQYKLDISAIKLGPLLPDLAENIDLYQQDIIGALTRLRQVPGLNLTALHDPVTGANLLHIAARHKALGLLKFIFENKIEFSPVDKTGQHFLDLLPEDMREIVRHSYKRSEQTGTGEDFSERMKQYFHRHAPDEIADYGDKAMRERLIAPARDFSMYGRIQYDRDLIQDNHVDPSLIVSEYALLSFDGGSHIRNTTRIAMGAGKALGSPDWHDVISVELNPATYKTDGLNMFLLYNRDDYVIISHSVGTRIDEDSQIEYQNGWNFSDTSVSEMGQWQFVYYNAAGNDNVGRKNCVTVDDVSFCMQNSSVPYHPDHAVRVGAVAETMAKRKLVVQEYSNERPTFCALLPRHQDAIYAGTSFTAPGAAAVEKRLADIFARSAALPDGVVHEDILMALMLTAESNNLLDEGNDFKIVPTYKNEAGLVMSDRCGAGAIREQAAADLLSQMVRWTRNDPDIEPTTGRSVRLEIKPDQGKKNEKGQIVYSFTAPADGILTQLRAGIPFPNKNRGAALIQIGSAPPVALDLARSGLTTEFRFAGYQFKAGEEIKLIVTRPLSSESRYKDSGFIDLRLVQTNSPIARAIEYMTAPALRTQ